MPPCPADESKRANPRDNHAGRTLVSSRRFTTIEGAARDWSEGGKALRQTLKEEARMFLHPMVLPTQKECSSARTW